ncbi:copper-translocating P-type ATPase [Lactobacillus bombicola]|nr:copper-translocating P-type ATPase [Lactobacillus bombicola]
MKNMDMGHEQHLKQADQKDNMQMKNASQQAMSDHKMMMHGGQMMQMGNLKQKFWWSFILALPILLLSPAMGFNLPVQFSFPGSDWLVVIFATILFWYGGEIFLRGAYAELKQKKPEMMTLISLGIVTAYLYSLYAFIQNNLLHSQMKVMDFFWELATLILIMLLGHWIEMTSVMKASSSVHDLAKLLPDKVHVQTINQIEEIKINDVQKQATIIVKPGESIPLDGIIISGSSTADESLVTGEARQITKQKGQRVIGGSINGSGTLTIKVTQTANSGFLASVNKLVQSSQADKSKLQTKADQVSGWLFYAALIIGLLALIVWTSFQGITNGLERMVTVLVIACPHALGLAIPLVNAKSTALGAKHGLLIRNHNAISLSSQINYLLLDKTGTLTQGMFQVRHYASLTNKLDSNQVLTIMASLEQDSTHPLAQSILHYAQSKKINLLPLTNSQNMTGAGVSGTIEQHTYQLVNEKAARKQVSNFPKLAADKDTISYLIQDSQLLGYIAVGDQIKASAFTLIKQIKERQITPVMLTGDNQKVADNIALQLGIDQVYAELLPQDKEKVVKKLQSAGNKVMMVGDGINDAPSLVKADIGVAIGTGTDVAVDSADVILVNSEPEAIISFLDLAQKTQTKTIQNLWWGAGYNIIALPLAAGILTPWGLVLPPAVGAILMSLSTVIVAINAEFLKI